MLLSSFPPPKWKLCAAGQKDRQQDHDVEPWEKAKSQLWLKKKCSFSNSHLPHNYLHEFCFAEWDQNQIFPSFLTCEQHSSNFQISCHSDLGWLMKDGSNLTFHSIFLAGEHCATTALPNRKVRIGSPKHTLNHRLKIHINQFPCLMEPIQNVWTSSKSREALEELQRESHSNPGMVSDLSVLFQIAIKSCI